MEKKNIDETRAKTDPTDGVVPMFLGYTITNQKETKNGEVFVHDQESVELAKKEVDMNHK